MTISLYDAGVASYLQILGGVARVLDKGQQFADETELDLDALVDFRLRDDMLPFGFQVISVWHHSLGAIRGMQAGLFEPPPGMGDLDYAGLRVRSVKRARSSARCRATKSIR
jgi:hypothetical protein